MSLKVEGVSNIVSLWKDETWKKYEIEKENEIEKSMRIKVWGLKYEI